MQQNYGMSGAGGLGPVGRIVALIVGLAVLAVSFVLGAFLLAAFLGFVVLAWAVMLIRVWWAQRNRPDEVADDGTIKAEYREVVYRSERKPGDSS